MTEVLFFGLTVKKLMEGMFIVQIKFVQIKWFS